VAWTGGGGSAGCCDVVGPVSAGTGSSDECAGSSNSSSDMSSPGGPCDVKSVSWVTPMARAVPKCESASSKLSVQECFTSAKSVSHERGCNEPEMCHEQASTPSSVLHEQLWLVLPSATSEVVPLQRLSNCLPNRTRRGRRDQSASTNVVMTALLSAMCPWKLVSLCTASQENGDNLSAAFPNLLYGSIPITHVLGKNPWVNAKLLIWRGTGMRPSMSKQCTVSTM